MDGLRGCEFERGELDECDQETAPKHIFPDSLGFGVLGIAVNDESD